MTWATLDPARRAHAETTLTERQLHIFRDRLNGHTWNTIALAYNIDEATARGHHRRALRRLDNARKEQAA